MPWNDLYCRAGGSNMNGGGLASGAEPATTPVFASTNGNWDATTGIFTVPSGNPSLTVTVGDLANVFLDGATTPVFVGAVTARDATTITVSLTRKSGTPPTTGATGRSINVGGAWLGPNGAVAFPAGFITNVLTDAAGNPPFVNLKNNQTYSLTSGIVHSNTVTHFAGYTNTARDGGKAVIDGGTSGVSYVVWTTATAGVLLQDIVFQNNGATGSANLVSAAGRVTFFRCVFTGARGGGVSLGSDCQAVECESYGNNTSNTSNLGGFVMTSARAIRCISHDNVGSLNGGFVISGGTLIQCIADSNGSNGYNLQSSSVMEECVAWSNGAAGVALASGHTNLLDNCILAKNGTYGITGGSTHFVLLLNCGFGGGAAANTSGAINPAVLPVNEIGRVTFATHPFVDPDNGDFRVVDSAAKGTGRGSFTQTAAGYSGTVGYSDLGAAQHQEVVAGPTYYSY